jgi:nitrate/nitrite-specific signal transduction histidine kinase
MIVFIILIIVCSSIYYFSYTNRVKNSKARLTNFAVTTGSLLSHTESFGHELMQKIDSSTTVALINKTVEVFDEHYNKIYAYSDRKSDSLVIGPEILDEAKNKGNIYFTSSDREVIAYQYSSNRFKAVIVVAAFDKDGEDGLQRLRFVLWSSFLAGMLIAAAGGYWFSKSLLKPVKKIADEVHEISAQNLTRRIQAGEGTDEWSYLSGTLNELLNRLQESFEIQGRFIANASHELSTPTQFHFQSAGSFATAGQGCQ